MKKPTIVEIETEERQTGKRALKELRSEKQVPAVVYGPEIKENINVSLSEIDVEKILSNSTTHVIKLTVKGQKENYDTLLKKVEFDRVSDRPIHVDLYAMEEGTPVIQTIPIRLVGTPTGVTEGGGRLYQPLKKLRVQCLPSKLPAEFTLDVSEMEIGESLNVEDLQTEGIKPLRELYRTVVVIRPPKGTIAQELGYTEEELEGEEPEEEEAEGEEAEGEAPGDEEGGDEEASEE